MKTCTVCGNAQSEGNFCGKCGGKLDGQAGGQTAATTQSVQPVIEKSEQLEKVKEQSKMYLSYFAKQLKSPSVQSDSRNSLISIGLYILLTVLAVYILLKGFLSNPYISYIGPSFFQIFFYATIFFLILIGVNTTAVFLTSKFFSENLKFSEVLTKLGATLLYQLSFRCLEYYLDC
ncbi:hypothetical protein QNH10_19395 [Sporosarcina thermotolerans]|uniref:hypothetical protein n=1 Tax=Sporosarcina thermotolerans TaxID=633404 RepID=UPI0024BD1B64|nr:hypothetical protein [Sporosarcina thermotolerans]WHT48161.1 hypothetical protein QNH10_19395 [Sporosarcina thermotolerans]